MISLVVKEINSFSEFAHRIHRYFRFLLTISLFTWVFPDTQFNIPASGYATVDPLFILTPWVYMFLVPAITMRLFSEENKSGTMELLLTRPLTELQIVLAKYSAGLVLVVFSLLPTLFYFFSVYQLGAPRKY